MGRKASVTDEQLNMIHNEMVTNNWTVKDAAAKNSILAMQKMTLYMAFRRKGLATKLEKKSEISV